MKRTVTGWLLAAMMLWLAAQGIAAGSVATDTVLAAMDTRASVLNKLP